MNKLFLFGLLSLFSTVLQAGQFYEANGVAIKGFDPVAYFVVGKATKGLDTISAEHKGSKFLFSSVENKNLFVKNPEKYAPQYNGYCAYGVAKGAKAKIEGEAFKIVEGKLYLNYDKSIQEDWEKKQDEYINKAEMNWAKVSQLTKVVQ